MNKKSYNFGSTLNTGERIDVTFLSIKVEAILRKFVKPPTTRHNKEDSSQNSGGDRGALQYFRV